MYHSAYICIGHYIFKIVSTYLQSELYSSTASSDHRHYIPVRTKQEAQFRSHSSQAKLMVLQVHVFPSFRVPMLCSRSVERHHGRQNRYMCLKGYSRRLSVVTIIQSSGIAQTLHQRKDSHSARDSETHRALRSRYGLVGRDLHRR